MFLLHTGYRSSEVSQLGKMRRQEVQDTKINSYIQVSTPSSVRRMPARGYIPCVQIMSKHTRCYVKKTLLPFPIKSVPNLSIPVFQPLTALPVLSPQVLDPSDLSLGKGSVASIDRVIHVVMDRVKTSLSGTTILGRAGRAAVGADALHRGIGDVVAVARAAVALEGVQESEPVARLVHRRHARVVAVNVAGWHRLGLHVAAVGHVHALGRCAGADVRWQGADAQDAAGEIGLEVDVERAVGALAQRGFHSGVIGACAHGPGVVRGDADAFQCEADAVWVVACVHGGHLGLRHCFRDGAGTGFLGYDVEVGRDIDGGSGACDVVHELRRCAWVAVQVVQGSDGLLEVVGGVVQADAAAGVLEGRVGDVGGLQVAREEAAVGELGVGHGGTESGEEECSLHIDGMGSM